ncbi:related to acid phosphatase [Melanopsichium pennsylvanicum]|uniref:Related to acid phosphatase n=2 Tax=Melanopsichium pennsylvanicum TaxID=63383 RepID=A0AAJ4XR62_9BASI|nr:related to acid phosphatase [Melanopsichium pennsylvanicum 4]SNX87335.1 related to acid phosphatase [Melanopsichium pennsylvanicum]
MKAPFAAAVVAVTAGVSAGPIEKRAHIAQSFSPPSTSPLVQSSNYVGYNNASYPTHEVVPGKAFDRVIQIWLENTDYEAAISTPAMQALIPEGVLFDNYYAVTHPSEPNYIASVAGDFFGLADDSFNHIPTNITTVFDLLDDGGKNGKPISYACYNENMPYDGFTGFNYTSKNYITPGAPDYTYYVRKHNPCAIMDYVSGNKTRALYNRNFNDLAADIGNNTVPQWLFNIAQSFLTPNMLDDGHDTSAAFFSNWTDYFLTPLLKEPKFNSNRTLVLLTFDENDSYTAANRIFTIALGGAIPSNLKNTTDHTYMTHYSALSSVEANWGLKSLGRGDTNKTMSNVFPLYADVFGYQNTQVDDADIPQTNLTGVAPGPLSDTSFTLFYAPDDVKVVGAGGQPVLVKNGLNISQTLATLPQSNLTALGQKNIWNTDPGYNNVNVSVAAAKSGHSVAKTNSAAKPVIAGTGIIAGVVFAAASLLL